MFRSERGGVGVLTITVIVVFAFLAIVFPVWMLVRGTQRSAERTTVPVEQARDVQADALLIGAASVARSYLAEHGSFEGFTPETAARLDPSFVWNVAPVASPRAVSIRGVTPTSLALVTLGAGRPLCLGLEADETRRGFTEARSAADCLPAP